MKTGWLGPMVAALLAILTAAQACAAPDPAVVHANAVRAGLIGYREGWFGEGDARLHYVEAGKGPLVLLYHGFPSFWFSWFDQMEGLKSRYRVVAVDGLGAGLSAKPIERDAYRVERLAAPLDALARHLAGRKRFILIGHDWGAALAFAYAQAYPDRLRAVIGMSAPPFNLFLELVREDPEQQARSTYMQLFRRLDLESIKANGAPERIWRQAYGSLAASGHLSAAEFDLFRQALADPRAIDSGMNWYRANIPPFEAIGDQDRWPIDNRPIAAPALLIWGEQDKTFVPAFLDLMPNYAGNLRIERIPDVGHWTSIEHPERAIAAIDHFLTELDQPSRRR